MLSTQDCLDYCDLIDDEVAMLAHHEHLPYPAAVQLACCLVQTDEGTQVMRCILKDCLCEAEDCGGRQASEAAQRALQHFSAIHPA
jgi:hypothetical protein